jgi:glyoxylase-like metal-dependent hydrolase (beta-lactamase superfamily II)
LADLLAPGLWWLHGTRGSNVYLVEAEDGQLALVDTGFGSSAGAILDEVRAHGGKLSAILLTHVHADHSGAAAAVRSATGARVFLGKGDCLERAGRFVLHPAVGRTHFRRRLTRRAHLAPGEDAVVDVPLAGECDVLPGIRAVPVAGHTPGAYCFVVDRLGAAFVGDLVISHAGELTRSMKFANSDDAQYLQSIRHFAAVAPSIGLSGHGTPVMEGFGDALRVLAELPRRRGAAFTVERVRRLARFSKGMSRVRHGTHGAGPSSPTDR